MLLNRWCQHTLAGSPHLQLLAPLHCPASSSMCAGSCEQIWWTADICDLTVKSGWGRSCIGERHDKSSGCCSPITIVQAESASTHCKATTACTGSLLTCVTTKQCNAQRSVPSVTIHCFQINATSSALAHHLSNLSSPYCSQQLATHRHVGRQTGFSLRAMSVIDC